MKEDYEPSHRETQTRLPEPLEGKGFWHAGTWALPASALSTTSVVVFVLVWLFLQSNGELRSLFVPPLWVSAVLSLGSAGLVWSIVRKGRDRPGRLWPRLWALVLACLNSLIFLLVLAFAARSWVHALVFAGVAAALTLAPRALKLRPDSAMVQWVAPLAFAGVLAFILPGTWGLGQGIVASKSTRVDRMIQQVRLWTTEVREATAHDWSQMEEDPEAASESVLRLVRIKPAGQLDDPDLWREAAILGREQELAERSKELVDAVADGFSPDRVPRVSSLEEPAIYWSVDARRWQASPGFPKASETVGQYYQEVGRLLADLDMEGVLADSRGLVDLKEYCSARKAKVKALLADQMEQWADNWAVFRVPELGAGSKVSRAKLLQASVTSSKEAVLRPADLPFLLKLPLGTMRRWEKNAAGCHPLPDYSEGPYEYYRVDCYSYTPRAQGLGADLSVEMRLVYRSQVALPLSASTLPAEVYFLFPIADGEGSESFGEQVMADLANAVRKVSGASVMPKNKSRSVSNGFRVGGEGLTVVVNSPRVIALLGDQRGLEIRAERQ